MSSQRFVAGGVPSTLPDVPVSVIFLVSFASLAFWHMRTFILYKKRFVWSAATFGFCMSRIVAFSLRIAWSQHPHDRDLALAQQVFVQAGTVLLYVITLQYWKKSFFALFTLTPKQKLAIKLAFEKSCFVLIPVIIITIVAAVTNLLTTDRALMTKCVKMLRFSNVFQTIYAGVTIPLTIISLILFSLKATKHVDVEKHPFFHKPDPKEGKRSVRSHEVMFNLFALLFIACILFIEAVFRCVISFTTPTRYVWYFSKASFYGFQTLIELSVVVLFALLVSPHRFGRFSRTGNEYHAEEKSLDQTSKDHTLGNEENGRV